MAKIASRGHRPGNAPAHQTGVLHAICATALAELAAFDRRTAFQGVVLSPDTRAEKIAAFCDVENAGWLERRQNLQIIYRKDETLLP